MDPVNQSEDTTKKDSSEEFENYTQLDRLINFILQGVWVELNQEVEFTAQYIYIHQ